LKPIPPQIEDCRTDPAHTTAKIHAMSRRTFCVPILLAAFVAFAQLPAEVEITNEPHHHFLFQNELVRVFKVEVAPGEATLIHRHRHDYIYVTLGDCEVSNDVVGKPAVRLKLHDGDTGFLSGGYAHSARPVSPAPLRNITVELLQGDKAPHNASTLDGDRGLQVLPGGTRQILFVKDGVSASEIELQAGGSIPRHHHTGPHLVVALTDLDLRSNIDGKAPISAHIKSGEAQWIKGGVTHTLTNVGKQPAKFVTLEFP
jgi:quercetin dioxygenase-like cupin family protein